MDKLDRKADQPAKVYEQLKEKIKERRRLSLREISGVCFKTRLEAG